MVDATVVVSTAVALLRVPAVLRRPDGAPLAVRAVGPEVVLAAVVGLVYLNQLLFTVYVLRVHGGDVSFIARHLPAGWFATAVGNPLIEGLARHFPAPELLAPTVLRVQAFLELPFVLLAYVTVLRWLDRDLYRRVAGAGLVWAAAASYTLVFCVVEWQLRNPYTLDDVALRIAAAVVTPPLIRWLARGEHELAGPVEPLRFAVSAWALGHLVLVVYDTALLYNLGHLGTRLPGALIALAVLVCARTLRPGGVSPVPTLPGGGVATIAAGLRWSLALFLVPALAVRYGVNFATPLVAAAAGGVIVLAAAVHAVREGPPANRWILVWTAQLPMAAVAGLGAAYVAVRWVADTFYEAALLRAAATSLMTAVLVCGLTDRYLARTRGS
ncbi:MAG: hypothetical protein ACRDOO_09225 [Actinomadura sp.]